MDLSLSPHVTDGIFNWTSLTIYRLRPPQWRSLAALPPSHCWVLFCFLLFLFFSIFLRILTIITCHTPLLEVRSNKGVYSENPAANHNFAFKTVCLECFWPGLTLWEALVVFAVFVVESCRVSQTWPHQIYGKPLLFNVFCCLFYFYRYLFSQKWPLYAQ